MHLILTINGGSSSLRFALFDAGEEPRRLFEGKFDRLGLPDSRLETVNHQTREKSERPVGGLCHADCVPALVELAGRAHSLDSLAAVSYRIVHGGARYFEPQRIDSAMLLRLEEIRPFDREHLDLELALIKRLTSRFPSVLHVACFDTGFHRDLPITSRLLPIPRSYFAKGIRRYGFHGLSFASLLRQLESVAGPAAARGRVILAHLGNGSSLAAVRDGRSLDTTMAFTPAAGLVMSARSGDLDPGLVDYLARTEGLTAAKFQEMVSRRSGLLGLSETSSDVRDLLALERSDGRAAEALAVFCYQTRKWIGAFAAALGGLDTIVFSGGIGEHSPDIRGRVLEGLDFLGIEIDPVRNEAGSPLISRDGSRVSVRVMRTDEEIVLALAARTLLKAAERNPGGPVKGDTP